MRSLISAAIVVSCVCASVPAYAASHMSGHSMASAVHVGGARQGEGAVHFDSARQGERAVHFDRARHGEGEAHRGGGHHRHRISLLPFDFFDPASGPDATGGLPEPLNVDPAALAPPDQAADLPPCRETAAGGVVVLRGVGCTR